MRNNRKFYLLFQRFRSIIIYPVYLFPQSKNKIAIVKFDSLYCRNIKQPIFLNTISILLINFI